MDIAHPPAGSAGLIDIESRFRTVRLGSLHAPIAGAFVINVAGVNARISFNDSWAMELAPMCRTYWAPFLQLDQGQELAEDFELVFAPADGEFFDRTHAIWNGAEPFQHRIEDRTGTWIFHRDFTCLKRGREYRVWLPKPDLCFTDALDNVLAIAVRDFSESHRVFLFHSAVVEHEGRAVVFFGPSGIGKSTLARFSNEWGYRVMSSDQVYLRLSADRLWACASPTRNPDIPRDSKTWVTEPLEVKALFALKRRGLLDVGRVDRPEMTRRFFAEIFRNETDEDFAPQLSFAADVAMLQGPRFGSLSYPFGFNFWPSLKELGYI